MSQFKMSMTIIITILVTGVGISVTQAKDETFNLPEVISFNRDIQPIFSNTCFACHGFDEKERKAKLRLDLREGAIKDLGGYQAITPGDPEASEAWQLINSDDEDEIMPPKKFGKKITARQKAMIKKWIEQGAKYEAHWSFIPAERPKPAVVKNKGWVKSPIDTFVLSRLEREGLTPAREADRGTLIRRVTFDLTGLPPTPAQVKAFINDTSKNAYEKVIDRLLQSEKYGEHLTRYWLDAARYADTNGYQYDLEREQWAWRDWVINAFNTNMPFDQFTIEQIAGDLLPNATPQQILATGFNRNHPITIEGGVIDEEYRTEYVIDRVVTTGTIWSGLTLICSRCHDHKYDPISQKDFYQLFAFFNNVPERGLNGFAPKKQIPSPLQLQNQTAIHAEIEAFEKKHAKALNELETQMVKWEKNISTQRQNGWNVLKLDQMISAGGATLKTLPDGSTLATGKNPATETYTVTGKVANDQIKYLQLEAIKDPSLTNGSASRGSNGNFVLTEIQVEAAPANQPNAFKPVKISSAWADYSQKNFDINQAIDGKLNRNGWAVDGNTKPENRTAIFTFAQPVEHQGGSILRIKMVNNYGLSHQIGRFRFSTGNQKVLVPTLEALLNIPASKRNANQQYEVKKYLVGQYGSKEQLNLMAMRESLEARKEQAIGAIPGTLVMQEMPKPRKAYILHRGEYDKKEAEVSSNTPSFLPPMPKGVPNNRLGYAKWLTMRSNPLTARVTVNRIWQRFFGIGLVKTSEDFGLQGERPTHPELLDWLAVEFMDSGWDMKHINKTILMSATYRQSSVMQAKHKDDPENRLLSRGPRLRLDAEVIRDSALYVSGLLVDKVGGPSVFPYHPKGLWQEINNRPGLSRTYKQDVGDKLYRRSLYTFWKRTVPPPSLATFDAPDREYCVVNRARTNTPLQALVMLHDPQFVEAARFLAERMIREGGNDLKSRVSYGFMLCTSRVPNASELQILNEMHSKWLAHFKAARSDAEQVLSVGQKPRDEKIDLIEHAVYTQIARAMLNLSEFITKP